MTEARLEVAWDLQSSLMALIANINRDVKRYPKGFTPRDYNPMIKKAQRRVNSFNEIAEDIAVFKRMRRSKRMPKT